MGGKMNHIPITLWSACASDQNRLQPNAIALSTPYSSSSKFQLKNMSAEQKGRTTAEGGAEMA